MNQLKIKKRLEMLRRLIRNEKISYGEIAELQSLRAYIAPDDVELLQWAGVPENADECPECGSEDTARNSRGDLLCNNCGYEETEDEE